LGSGGASCPDGKEQLRVDFAAFCLVYPVHKARSQPPGAPLQQAIRVPGERKRGALATYPGARLKVNG
jgi:hypothetical protein